VCSLCQGTRLLPLENRRRWPPDVGAVFLLEVEARVPDEQTTPRRPREPRRQRSRRPAGQQSGKVVGVPTVAAAPRIFVTVTMLVAVVLDVDFVVVFFVSSSSSPWRPFFEVSLEPPRQMLRPLTSAAAQESQSAKLPRSHGIKVADDTPSK